MLARIRRAGLAIAAAPALLILSATALAENGVVMRQPVLGYLYDSQAGTIRPLAGVPGSGILAGRLNLGVDLGKVFLPPAKGWALVKAKGSSSLELVDWSGSSPRFEGLNGETAAPDKVFFSPRGAAAALYWADGGRLQVWTGFPGAPVLSRRVTLGQAPDGVALSDDGKALAVVVEDAVELFATGWQRVLLSGGPFGAVAFRPNSHDLAAAGGEDGRIRLLTDVLGPAAETTAVTLEQGAGHVSALALTADGRWLAFLNQGENAVRVASLGGGDPLTLACPCVPETLRGAGDDGVFLLKNVVKGSIVLLDLVSGEPRLDGVASQQVGGGRQ